MQAHLKCVIYTRVSTDNQAEVEFNSCEAQELPTMDAEHYRGRLSKCKEIHIVVKMYRRRGKGTAISLYDPLPGIPQKPRPVYNNVVIEALKVHAFLKESPSRTQTDAGEHFNLTRARISQLTKIVNNLPRNFVEKMSGCADQSMLKTFSGKRLLKIAGLKNEQNRQKAIELLLSGLKIKC